MSASLAQSNPVSLELWNTVRYMDSNQLAWCLKAKHSTAQTLLAYQLTGSARQ